MSSSNNKRTTLSPFDFLNSINSGYRTGKNLMANVILEPMDGVPDLETVTVNKAYVPFIINRGLSQHEDTVLFANEMNMRAAIPNRMQYDFYRYAVRPRKRFGKFAKGIPDAEVVDALIQLYKMNRIRARETVAVLTEEQKKELINKTKTGGRTK